MTISFWELAEEWERQAAEEYEPAARKAARNVLPTLQGRFEERAVMCKEHARQLKSIIKNHEQHQQQI